MNLAVSSNRSLLLLWPVYVHNQNQTAWKNVADAITQFRAAGAPMDRYPPPHFAFI